MRDRGIRRRRRRVAALALLLVASACSSDDQAGGVRAGESSATTVAAASTAAPTATDAPPATDAPVVSEATTTSAAAPIEPTTTAPATTEPPVSTLPALDAGPCAFTPFIGTSITFTVAGRAYELSPDRTRTTCIADESAAPTELYWSPSGERVLLDSSRVLDATGVRDTGYRADNTGVSWSFPTGKALIAPAVADGALLWRTAGQPGTRTDISFLSRTDVAAYHVAGKNVFAAGVDPDGVAGIFVASNRGENRRTVATLDDPSTRITELAGDTSGQNLFVVHDHGDMWELHSIFFPGLQLGTIYQDTAPISHLTVSHDLSSSVAVQVGDCASGTHAVVPGRTPADVTAGTELAGLSTTPVGWLDGLNLVVAARPSGCEGPADVWLVGVGAPVKVLSQVDTVSVRTAVGTFGELPDDINAQAPG